MNKYPITLCIDQGSHVSGFAVIQHDPSCDVSFGVNGRLIQHGVVILPNTELHGRIEVFGSDFTQIIEQFKPDEIVYEFTNWKQKSAAANTAMAALAYKIDELIKKFNLKKYIVNPKTVKAAVTGNGNAKKDEVIKAVNRLWGNPAIKDDNHADALATAYWWLSFRDEYIGAKTA